MSGGNSHDRRKFERAVKKQAEKQFPINDHPTYKTEGAESVPEPKQTTSITNKVFSFFEHPLFWGPVGVVGGVVGLFLYRPILHICGICIVLAFHRARVVSGERLGTQVISYCIVILFAGGGIYGLQTMIQNHENANKKEETMPNIAIFAQCDNTALPIEIPPHGSIRLVPVNKKGMQANKWGSYDVRNDKDKPEKWPEGRKLLEAKQLHDSGVFIYRCEVSNHGQPNLLDIAMPMRFWFGDKGGDENAVEFTPIISPLDVGHSSILYFVNDCPTNASGVLPDSATVAVAGENARRTTKLNLPHRNPTDQLMFWFPAKVRWVSSTQCE